MRPLSLLTLLPIAFACTAEKPANAPKPVERAMVVALFGSPPSSPKVDNPLTEAKIAIGRELYHDKRLSKHGDISCASCHDLDNFGQDGKPTSPGTAEAAGKRNTPTSFNAFRQFAQFWDHRAETVEQQSTMPMLTANEHGLADEAEIEKILKSVPEYAAKFAAAFPGPGDPITADNLRLAIGAFERTLATRSRFDDYLDGEDGALTDQEKRGLATFVEVGCTTCHMGRLVGGGIAQKLGLVKPYESEDLGRYEVTKTEADKYMFKVPQLLNIAKTGPYFHDGSIATLEETVRLMGRHQNGRELTDVQVADIVAFLGSLTGELQKQL